MELEIPGYEETISISEQDIEDLKEGFSVNTDLDYFRCILKLQLRNGNEIWCYSYGSRYDQYYDSFIAFLE